MSPSHPRTSTRGGIQDPAITTAIIEALAGIEPMIERMRAVRELHPASAAALDGHRWQGHQVYAIAGTAWAGATDHALTWLELMRARVQPERSHYTLARAILEGAGTVHWLLSPEDGSLRWRRGLNFMVKDYRERAEYEAMPGALVDTPGPRGMSGAQRREWLLEGMRQRRIPVEQPPGFAKRLEPLGLTWLYSLCSAFAHGQQWNSGKVKPVGVQPLANSPMVTTLVTTANDELAAVVARQSMAAHEVALIALERYVAPIGV